MAYIYAIFYLYIYYRFKVLFSSHNYQTRLKQSVNLDKSVAHKEFRKKVIIHVDICILCIMLNINLILYKYKYHYKTYLKDLNLNQFTLKTYCILFYIF